MKTVKPNYFDDFKCSASLCTDNCCKFWQVEIDDKSAETYICWINENNERGLLLKDSVVGRRHMRMKHNSVGDCCFLQKDGLCKLQCAAGHSALPYTCRMFPRFLNVYGNYEEIGLSFSCPTAAELIVGREMILVEAEDGRSIYDLTEVDAELFFSLKNLRKTIFKYIDEFDGSVELLMSSVAHFAYNAQTLIDKHDTMSLSELSINDFPSFIIETLNVKREKIVKHHLKNCILNNEWKDLLEKSLRNSVSLELNEFKCWLKYFLFRYLIKAAEDGKIYQKVKAAIVSYFVIAGLGVSFVNGAQKYSKEIEHNEKNIARLTSISKKIRFKSIENGRLTHYNVDIN